MIIKCDRCGYEFEENLYNSLWGWRAFCTRCSTIFYVDDINDYLVPDGTKVKLADGRIGIVDGNDEEVSEDFKNINYFICPIEYTDEEYWSDYYLFLLREEFEIVEE